MSSSYSIALSLIFLPCVFREFEGQEACKSLWSGSLVERLLFISPRNGGDGWSVMVPCSRWDLIMLLPAKLIQNCVSVLAHLAEAHFEH